MSRRRVMDEITAARSATAATICQSARRGEGARPVGWGSSGGL